MYICVLPQAFRVFPALLKSSAAKAILSIEAAGEATDDVTVDTWGAPGGRETLTIVNAVVLTEAEMASTKSSSS